MSENAFNKRLAPETAMDKVEGLLEHFSLPPKVIAFIRKNQRKIQIAIGVVIVAVVAWSLYDAHREKVIEQGATALSTALQGEEGGKKAALNKVVEDFGSTSSARWAQLELGHIEVKAGNFEKAVLLYDTVLNDTKKSNPLYPLVIYAKAQALEAKKDYLQATSQYDLLKEEKGYQHIAFLGKGRIEEAQGHFNKAVAVYNNFLLAVGDDPSFSKARTEIDAKIARLKTIE